jgi:hypothetical protein
MESKAFLPQEPGADQLISQEKNSQHLIDWSDPRAYLDMIPKIRIRAPAEKLTQVVQAITSTSVQSIYMVFLN